RHVTTARWLPKAPGQPDGFPGRSGDAAPGGSSTPLFAFARRSGALARCIAGAELLDHAPAVFRGGILILGPPLAQAVGLLASGFAQEQEIIGGTEARVLKHLIGTPALTALQARLQVPDLAQRDAETLGNGGVAALFDQYVVSGLLLGGDQRNALAFQFPGALGQSRPQQRGKQERRSNRTPLVDALVGVAQGLAYQLQG